MVVAKRLRLADREPMAIETLHVREALVPGLTADELEGSSFYELLAPRYGIVIVGGMQTIEPTVTNEEESAALGVPLHSPAFLFERVTHSESGEIVEFVHSIYRGDRYRLVTELNAAVSAPSGARRAADALVKTTGRMSGEPPGHDRECGLDIQAKVCKSPPRGQVV